MSMVDLKLASVLRTWRVPNDKPAVEVPWNIFLNPCYEVLENES